MQIYVAILYCLYKENYLTVNVLLCFCFLFVFVTGHQTLDELMSALINASEVFHLNLKSDIAEEVSSF